jgi:Fur family transcriptional regulator, peroxide stress response regulator
MRDPHRRLGQMTKGLREQGCRLTPQRLAMLKIIANSDEHPSVDQLFEQIRADFPTTSLATIYKTLNLLKAMGEVLELNLAGVGSRYDGNKPYPHPHVICTKCGRILDPEFTGLADISSEMAKKTGFHITHSQLNFFGLCSKCQQEGQPGNIKKEQNGTR